MHRRISLLLAGVFVVALAINWSGCEADRTSSEPVALENQQGLTQLSKSDSRVRAVMAIQDRHTPGLMKQEGVVGTATGLSESGDLVVKVYTSRAGIGNLPSELDGIKVEVEVTGEFRAMGRPGGGGGGGGGKGGVSHTAIQNAPIKLGTSGGWRYDLANGYCCGGTLGSLISIGGTQYVLSNYHVLNADIVSGGNSRIASNGDYVIQPGLIDAGCNANNAQNVATLSFGGSLPSPSLPGSNVDAAIAQVIAGMVSSTGEILEVGTLSSSTVGASLNQSVKKSGRTTGLTRSKISGLNAAVSVQYDNECAGGPAFVKTYSRQIIITNRGSKFLNSGDSGSLMVEDVSTNPRAVGLLFAGSSTSAVANPIDEVLGYFGASMVGN